MAVSPARHYALRFISGKYQGGQFELARQGEIIIGRSSELDVVLVEDMVSRKHAKLGFDADELFIQDLESTNGTFVNGEKIKRAKLREGDRILIGTSIIKLVQSEGGPATSPGEPKSRDESASGKRSTNVRTMSGSIAEIPIPDLLQLFSGAKKSGVLVVRSETNDVGKIFLETGRPIFAAVNDQFDIPPLKTLSRIINWRSGTFDMEPPEVREFGETIQMSTEGILMEASRQMDEFKRIEADLPALSRSLSIPNPLKAPLRELEPVELEVFQLAMNYGKVGSVLDRSALSDLETGTAMVMLIRRGYLKVN